MFSRMGRGEYHAGRGRSRALSAKITENNRKDLTNPPMDGNYAGRWLEEAA